MAAAAGAVRRGHRQAVVTGYAMGRTASERERLGVQGRILTPHSANLFRQAGIGPGSRVLDAGCGTGDSTRLLAELVGPDGTVIGVDNDPASLKVARALTEQSGIANIRYEEGDLTDPADLADLVLDEPVDALAGRIVLLHIHDPASVLARLVRWVRPGGAVVFQDISCSRVRAVPQVPAMEDWLRWMRVLSAHAGLDPDIGEHLSGIFSRAGLAHVNAAAVSVIGDSDSLVPNYLAETLTSVGPLAVASGAATQEQVDGFFDTLFTQARAAEAVLYAQELTCAWAHVPADEAARTA
jgi:SAM-dependent methyltransferase